jgi:hypothetical protein
LSSSKLGPLDPILLSSALSLSIIEFELNRNITKGLEIAKKTFNEAVAALDTVDMDDSTYKDVCLTLQLLRDNITLWDSMHE